MDSAALLLSLELAALTVAILLPAGVVVARFLATRDFAGKPFVEAAFALPLVLPPTVLGYYLFTALGPTSGIGRAWHAVFGGNLVFTFKGAVIAATVGSLPLVVRSVLLGLDAVEPTLLAAARTLGARPARVLFTVRLPLAGPGLLAGGMLGFARALGEFGATIMVAGSIPGRTRTLALAIFHDVQVGEDGHALALAGVTVAVAFAVLWTTERLTRGRAPEVEP